MNNEPLDPWIREHWPTFCDQGHSTKDQTCSKAVIIIYIVQVCIYYMESDLLLLYEKSVRLWRMFCTSSGENPSFVVRNSSTPPL